jgi:hypothetical protein
MRKKKQTERRPAEGPPDAFCEWWNPSGIDPVSGASIGGHIDAERVWARKDPGRWNRRTYGMNARIAWQADFIRQEFSAWERAGSPEREPFVSIAQPMSEQVSFWHGLKEKLAEIGKKVLHPMPHHYGKDKAPFREPLELPEAGVIDAEFTKVDDDAIDFNHREYPS